MSAKSYQCKMVIIGDSTVGKTTLLNRYVKDTIDLTLQTTIGVSFFHKNVYLQGNTYKLEIYDTAGQERFNSLVPMYYQRSHFCFIVFDLQNLNSFQRVEFWENELKKNTNSDGAVIQRVVVGNKCDKDVSVNEQEVINWCKGRGVHYYRVSALTGEGVNEMFNEILMKYSWQPAEDTSKVGQTIVGDKKKGCC
ncbi:Rab1a [Hexamita inflata]|uniref:Rab1a n=1 Tax=Hexamita inflata TaxID=28002 RepID=A0AA86RCQ9_9EUKA|nr:Rab1a [Hexamita inflata]